MTYAPVGLRCEPVTVEVAARPGLSSLTFVGLAGRAVAESKERIRIALRTLGIPLPTTAVVVNLAPAELVKNGTHYDLPITIALLMAMGELTSDAIPPDTVIAGELGLNGDLRRLKQAVNFTFTAKVGQHPVIMPKAVQPEVALVKHNRVALYGELKRLVQDMRNKTLTFAPAQQLVVTDRRVNPAETLEPVTFDDIAGQVMAKRALTIAVAGGHNILLTGPPGVGKSMLIEAAAGLLPPLTEAEQLECTTIYSAAGLLTDAEPVIERAPWRNPHHRATTAAILGGGSILRPGEISLAHRGILFLDELPHFRAEVLEALREPLQRQKIIINRANGVYEYPCSFMLAAAFNPCPCGWAGDVNHTCRCSPADQEHYLDRLSGPILDRFSLFVRCTGVASLVRSEKSNGEHLRASRSILAARSIQQRRQQRLNSSLGVRELKPALDIPWVAAKLNSGLQRGGSVRAAHQALRVALTIADLAGDSLREPHLVEALGWLPPATLVNGP